MKATELMIGDWMHLSYRDVAFNFRITEIKINYGSEHQVWGYSEDGKHRGNMGDISNIEPVPLTPEILEKNGFVKNIGVTSWKFETDGEDLVDIYGVKEYHLSINIEDTHGSGKGYRWMLNNLVIFYVHQLQHALRLCGIEKEIKL